MSDLHEDVFAISPSIRYVAVAEPGHRSVEGERYGMCFRLVSAGTPAFVLQPAVRAACLTQFGRTAPGLRQAS